eukprot:PhF_6_TR16941/c0_g1_i1/m.25518/K05991/E3.2.1.123; endoglycosylceramidase
MKHYGFNAARLGLLWYDIEIAPGIYNDTYLAAVKADVDMLWSRGIRAFLDLHQDCFSTYFCTNQDGVPDYIGHPPNSTEYYVNGSLAFPKPIAEPKYSTPITGLPWGRISNCGDVAAGPFGWASCYTTYAASATVQTLYDNDNGALDRMAAMWKYVASKFKGHPGVLGYELMNEPWLGAVPLTIEQFFPPYKYWDLWYPGVGDKVNLAPFYNTLHDAIRSVDNETIIFFEPGTGGNILGSFNVGFTSGPGGVNYDKAGLNVLSYHIYCPFIESDMPAYNSSNAVWQYLIEQLELVGCDLLNGFQFDRKKEDVTRLGVGGFMSEFGAIPDDLDGQRILDFALTRMDQNLHSWTYWYIDADNSSSLYQRNPISRPFPHVTWGIPTTLQFDNTTKTFEFWYKTPTTAATDNTTKVYLSPVQYPNGALFWVAPAGQVVGTIDASSSMLVISHLPSFVLGSVVNVTVVPAPQQ